MNTWMTRRKKKTKITYLKEDALFVHFSFILHFGHLTCFLRYAYIRMTRNSFSCNMLQIIAFSFYSYSLLVMAFHRYFFSQQIRLIYYYEKLSVVFLLTFYSLVLSAQKVCYSYISGSLVWITDKLTLGLCRPEWCAKIAKYMLVLHLWSGFWYQSICST